MNAAQTILQQLGGNKFLALTGASQLVGSPDALQFSLPRRAGQPNKVRITLANDLYAVEFYSLRGVNLKLLASVEGVYANRLQAVFTEQTGLDTKL